MATVIKNQETVILLLSVKCILVSFFSELPSLPLNFSSMVYSYFSYSSPSLLLFSYHPYRYRYQICKIEKYSFLLNFKCIKNWNYSDLWTISKSWIFLFLYMIFRFFEILILYPLKLGLQIWHFWCDKNVKMSDF